jgi:hypothetical protein
MSQTFHLCISVRWMLHWSNVEAKRNMRSITKSDGSHYITCRSQNFEMPSWMS